LTVQETIHLKVLRELNMKLLNS